MKNNPKANRVKQISQGAPVSNDIQEEISEIETLEKQQEIHQKAEEKSKFIVALVDGTTIDLPNELKVVDVRRRRTFEAIWACAQFIGNVSEHYKAEFLSFEQALRNALMNPNVRLELEQLVARVTNTAITKLEANLTQDGALVIYYWMSTMVAQNKSGESQSPNDKK